MIPHILRLGSRAVKTLRGYLIAYILRLRFDGEQQWYGQPNLWAFTDTDPRSPGYGCTFYVEPGSSFEKVRARAAQKRQEFEHT